MSGTGQYPTDVTNLRLLHQGKTRDTFAIPQTLLGPGSTGDHRLIVATRRLSTHNIVHESEIPRKDEVLTALTIYWLTMALEGTNIRHHLRAWGTGIYGFLPGTRSEYPKNLHLRAIVVETLDMIPVEFIYRAYLAGSLYDKYHALGVANPYGVEIHPSMRLMSSFSMPIFTPTDKSETDEPLLAHTIKEKYPEASRVSRRVFNHARDYLHMAGLELVDSKFELGLDREGRITLADEVVTPDSSRFCDPSLIEVGKEPAWVDKQVARNEASRIWGKGKKVPLSFTPEVVRNLSETYLDVFKRITGFSLDAFQGEFMNRI
ncbi:MAG: phosphoribosylaminoimidazole-succinocarboxamide synthase [Parcubacteria bacterium C7867-005]|nr:MAG: phosphoribosylaminoimidazole-succinocarboxamide synthase [Parcubacteria bacterium C7867-005]